FAPHMQPVTSIRNVGNTKVSVASRDGVKRRRERDHDRAHLGMNITEDVADPRPVKSPHAGAARLIETEVESLPLKEREDVVKKGIVVWERHRGTRRYNQDM